MNRRTGAIIVALVCIATLTSCSDSVSQPPASSAPPSDSDLEAQGLRIGAILARTGSFAELGAAQIAGVQVAIDEINAGGGIAGLDVEVAVKDASDAQNPDVAASSAQALIEDGVPAIIGSSSSSVSLEIIDEISAAGIVMVSPSDTFAGLSGSSGLFFRVVPPDTVHGDVLGNVVISDGASNVAFIVAHDPHAMGLRDAAAATIYDAGGQLVSGNSGQEFDAGTTTFSAIVADALSSGPEAVVVLASPDRTREVLLALVAAGQNMSKVYLADSNVVNYGVGAEGLPAGALTGAQGTLPGQPPPDEFAARMSAVDPDLTTISYGPEAYDATMLISLAALEGDGVDADTIRQHLSSVSGAAGGTECSGWTQCARLIDEGERIAYRSVSGAGPFNAANDPSSAVIGIYQYNAENTPAGQRIEEVEAPLP
ncbi:MULTISPECIES: ABC transporter substrate-binding protein [unclassified Microbacterium]|uniref:ABC transporter substrate-binding protein n=1 Tax=unclassified Microbacterium TaxID=2609290 RepID=UPI00214C3B0A|nr:MULTISPECIES: ABC transporter substrate-binding protein [unclassified Microbacterium]MCR2784535.1 ABC transporter substrate-binding protein [Microbacterium sp. zg.B96]WIM14654.1 ABC transporter substrate-binding protein [Microbacterium sp. zg-B96]